MNAPSYFINIAKNYAFAPDPNNSTADGYPTSAAGAFGGSGGFPPNYYGQYVWKFSGLGSMQTGGSMLIASATANGTSSCVVELYGAKSGQVFGNITILSQTNPRVVFTWGWNIQSISDSRVSNGHGGTLIAIGTTTGLLNVISTGTVIQIAGTGTALDGTTWTITVHDPQTAYLQGSTYTSSSGAGGTCAYAPTPNNMNMYGSGTFGSGATQMSNLVICKLANETLAATQINDPDIITQLKALYNSGTRGNPGWIRFMDFIGAQTNFESDFSQRMPATAISYSVLRFPLGYWAGNISWSSGDHYTCSDPSVTTWDSGNSAYFDNAVVQGVVDLNNLGTNPTLAVGGHPAKPIFNFIIQPLYYQLWGKLPSAAGQTIQLSFQASWLNSGTAHVVTYTTVAGDTTNFQTLYSNLGIAINGDATLAAVNISVDGAWISCRTTRAGALTVTMPTAPSGLSVTVGNFQPLSISSNTNNGGGFANTLRVTMAGTIVTGDILNFTFTRSDLNAGAVTVSYTTNTTSKGPGGVPDSRLANLVTNLIAQINNNGYLQARGLQVTASGVSPANSFDVISGNGSTSSPLTSSVFTGYIRGTAMTVSAMNRGTIEIGSYVNDGGAGGGVALYTQVLSQTGGTTGGIGTYTVSISQTVGSVGTQFTMWTGCTDDAAPYDSWTGGGLILSFSKAFGSGTETAAIGSAGGYKASFIYNYLLDGWILRGPSGIIQSQPFEAIAEMCNLVGAHCWFNWGTHKASFVTAVGNFFATNLNSGLKFGTEPGNEIWNFSASGPWGQWTTFGALLNFSPGSNNPNYSYAALRLIQYTALAKAAWTSAGRAASDYVVHQPSAAFDDGIGSGFQVSQLNGTALTTSNGVYAAHGTLGGGSLANSYNTFPNRPADITDSIGVAPYWSSIWFGFQGLLNMNGTVAQNAPWLQAALDYTKGSTSTAFTSMVNQFDGTTARSGGTASGNIFGTGRYLGVAYVDKIFTSNEALAKFYDGARPSGKSNLIICHYESGNQWGPTSNGSINWVDPNEVTNLANTMSGLGWNVSAYTVSRTNNYTECATQVLTMCVAWKHDVSYKTLITTYYYQHLANISGINREIHPAQYGFDGATDTWSLWPGSFGQGNPFQSYHAIQSWNA
jgi:hypothetical protein